MSHPTTAEILARQEARRTVLAKWNDGAAEITEADCKLLSGAEINQLVNAGRVPGVGADKRAARRR